MMRYEFDWERVKDGARLLRVHGITAEVILPEEIAGLPLTEIGACCFAKQICLPEHYETAEIGITGMSGQLRELSGSYIEKIVLPDSVKRIGNRAFYNCTSLCLLEFGSELTEVGGDAFMNCHKLHNMTVRGGGQAAAGIRQMLAQISSDMEVTFEGKDGTFAKLLFPEYYESYDEIAPAHLFGRNIEGEGFRARQCVREGTVDFRLYDTIFPKACAEEREKTLCRLAMNRLRYPVDLGAEVRELYEAYVRAHAGAICEAAVRAEEEEIVWFLCEQGLLTAADIDRCIRLATEQEWAKGAAGFLRAKEQFFAPKPVEERYSFDDFV